MSGLDLRPTQPLVNGYQRFFQWHEVGHSLLSVADARNKWYCTVLYCTSAPAVCCTVSTAATVPVPFGSGALVVPLLKIMMDFENS